MKVSIDTCIFLDLLLDQNPDSIEKLRKHHKDHDDCIICGLVYGELHPFFEENKMDLELFLSEMGIRIEAFTNKDFALSGKRWRVYCKRRRFACQTCGRSIHMKCPHCNSEVRFRQHILSDFIIGAFSELHCDGILTRDYGYYRTYFPDLKRF